MRAQKDTGGATVVKQDRADGLQDSWNADTDFFSILHNESPHLLERVFAVCFDSVAVHGTEGLHSLSVQLFLDDTTNGVNGLGNTRFIDLKHDPESKEKCTRVATNVCWPMMGAVVHRRCEQNCCEDGGSCDTAATNTNTYRGHPKDDFTGAVGTLQMPNTVKIVVTGTVMKDGGAGCIGQPQTATYGVVGGTTVLLLELFEGLRDNGNHTVSIRNSFIPSEASMQQKGGFVVPSMQIVFSSCKSGAKQDGAKQAAARLFGLKVEDAALCSSRCTGQDMYNGFAENLHLFKQTALLSKVEKQLVLNTVGVGVNQIWSARIDQKMYPLPTNAPSNFASLSQEQKNDILNKENVGGMFRSQLTPNGRNDCHAYCHSVAALPGMHNELQQTSLTNKEMIFHSFHAALTLFEPYGWTLQTIFKKVAEQQFEDGQIISFLACMVAVGHTMPSTQQYTSDMCLLKVPSLFNEQLTYQAINGEDWVHSNTQDLKWNSKTSTGSPSGCDDCESRSHSIIAQYLAIVEVAGGKGNHVVQTMGMQAVLQRVYEYVIPQALRHMATDAARTKASGGIQLQTTNSMEEDDHSLVKFCISMDAEMTRERMHTSTSADTNSNDHQQNWVRRTVQAIAVVAALFSSDSCRAHITLGGAYGAASVADQSRELHQGGHGYVEIELCGLARLVEGTACVPTTCEHANHVESVTKVASTMASLLNSKLETDTSPTGMSLLKCQNGCIRAMMTGSAYEHTGKFYGKAVTMSEALPMLIAQQKDAYRGCYLFTQDEKLAGRLILGANPENICVESTVRAQINGSILDSIMARTPPIQEHYNSLKISATARASSGATSSEVERRAADFCTRPLSTFVDASVAGVRELCGARCSYNQLDEWMRRMYCVSPHPLSLQEHNDTYDSPGKVVHLVATFKSGKDATEHCDQVLKAWRDLMTPGCEGGGVVGTAAGIQQLLDDTRRYQQALQQLMSAKGLMNDFAVQQKMAAVVHTVHSLESMMDMIKSAAKATAAAAKAVAAAAAKRAKALAVAVARKTMELTEKVAAAAAKKLKDKREKREAAKQAKDQIDAAKYQQMILLEEQKTGQMLHVLQEQLQIQQDAAIQAQLEADRAELQAFRVEACTNGQAAIECGGHTTLNVVHLWARFQHPLPSTVYKREMDPHHVF